MNMFNPTFDQFIHILTEEGQHRFVRLIQDEKGVDFSYNAVKRRHLHCEKRISTSVLHLLEWLHLWMWPEPQSSLWNADILHPPMLAKCKHGCVASSCFHKSSCQAGLSWNSQNRLESPCSTSHPVDLHPSLNALCSMCKPHEPMLTRVLPASVSTCFWKISNTFQFTFGPSTEIWTRFRVPITESKLFSVPTMSADVAWPRNSEPMYVVFTSGPSHTLTCKSTCLGCR